jgi:hypothetical protein
MEKISRRQLLRIAVIAGSSGCLGSGNEENNTTTRNSATQKTEPPSPTSEIPLVDSFPFEFEDTVDFPEEGVYGWLFSASFTLGVNFEIDVADDDRISLYVTDGTTEKPESPEESVYEAKNADSLDDVADIPGGHGAVLIETTQPTTLTVHVDVEEI